MRGHIDAFVAKLVEAAGAPPEDDEVTAVNLADAIEVLVTQILAEAQTRAMHAINSALVGAVFE